MTSPATGGDGDSHILASSTANMAGTSTIAPSDTSTAGSGGRKIVEASDPSGLLSVVVAVLGIVGGAELLSL